MTRLKNFFRTAVIGGAVAVLPLTILIIILKWLVGIVATNLEPVVNLFNTNSAFNRVLIYIIALAIIVFGLFLIGLLITTRMGLFLKKFEKKIMEKIPGYKAAKDIVMQFFGSNTSFFSKVVIADIFESGAFMTGFVTDEFGDYYSLFVPTGPNPTSGNIYHVHKSKVVVVDINVDKAMKTIISCGAGTSLLAKNSDISKLEKRYNLKYVPVEDKEKKNELEKDKKED